MKEDYEQSTSTPLPTTPPHSKSKSKIRSKTASSKKKKSQYQLSPPMTKYNIPDPVQHSPMSESGDDGSVPSIQSRDEVCRKFGWKLDFAKPIEPVINWNNIKTYNRRRTISYAADEAIAAEQREESSGMIYFISVDHQIHLNTLKYTQIHMLQNGHYLNNTLTPTL